MKPLIIVNHNELGLTEITSTSIAKFNNISISSEATFYVENSVDLAVVQAIDKYVSYIDEKLTYHITVVNKGPKSCSNVILTDIFSHNINLSSITVSQGSYSYSNGKVTCYLNTLVKDSKALINITVIPKSCGIIKNVTTVRCAEHDQNLNNNSYSKIIKICPKNNF